MRRPLLLVMALGAVLLLSVQPSSTASSSVATSTANYRTVTVQNSTSTATYVKGLSYLVVAGRTTQVQVQLNADLSTRRVRAQYGSSAAVNCDGLVFNLLNVLLGTGVTTATCPGLNEDAARPRSLVFMITNS